MDIYQIWTTYNKQWSRYEILAFTGVLILVCTAMAVCVHRKKVEYNSGSSSIGVGGVPGNCIWINCIYQDGNYSSV